MKIMLILMTALAATYANMSNPLMFMLTIVAQSLMTCIMSWTILSTSWFSYILFLIFLGGLMVLFIYITSLASNEMFNLKVNTFLNIALSLGLMMTTLLLMNQEMKAFQTTATTGTFLMLFSSNFKVTLMLAMIYLIFTLIVVVKIANKIDAPIKNLI